MFFLTDDIPNLNQLYLFGQVARASPEDDCRRAFLATIGNHGRMERPQQRHRTTWTQSVEDDLAHRNIGLHSDVRQAKDRSCWRVATDV